jgi:hypothetical protein
LFDAINSSAEEMRNEFDAKFVTKRAFSDEVGDLRLKKLDVETFE